MRKRIWSWAIAAAVAVAGAANAQTPAPVPAPAAPPVAMPAPAGVASPAPAPAVVSAAPAAACATPAVADCAPAAADCDPCKGGKLGRLFGAVKIGEGCANPVDCGSCASEKTFLFGSCKQFFNPGNDCAGCKKCPPLLLGKGLLANDPCHYGAFTNR